MNLKPCPFCGEEPFQGTLGEYWHLISCKCGIPYIRETSAYIARIKWNSRKSIDEKPKKPSIPTEHIQTTMQFALSDLPEFISIRDVKRLTGFSVATWYRMVKDGRAPKHFRFGTKMTRWRKADILAFIRGEYNK